jgi:hypothetical protein
MEYGDKRFLTANDTAIAFIPASRGSPLAEVSIYDLRIIKGRPSGGSVLVVETKKPPNQRITL